VVLGWNGTRPNSDSVLSQSGPFILKGTTCGAACGPSAFMQSNAQWLTRGSGPTRQQLSHSLGLLRFHPLPKLLFKSESDLLLPQERSRGSAQAIAATTATS
jgi:hypothetical protein